MASYKLQMPACSYGAFSTCVGDGGGVGNGDNAGVVDGVVVGAVAW